MWSLGNSSKIPVFRPYFRPIEAEILEMGLRNLCLYQPGGSSDALKV
jgi:hypothetical protein